MTFATFRALFEPVVRVQLDWGALAERDEIGVREIVVTDSTDFRGWFFPWYVDADRARRTEHTAPHSRPLEVPEARDGLAHLLPGIDEIALGLERDHRLRPLLFAAYELGSGKRLLLDGNHTLAALLREQVPFTGLVLSLAAPCDSDLLPDLSHWQT